MIDLLNWVEAHKLTSAIIGLFIIWVVQAARGK